MITPAWLSEVEIELYRNCETSDKYVGLPQCSPNKVLVLWLRDGRIEGTGSRSGRLCSAPVSG
jgi:hypothetical protein